MEIQIKKTVQETTTLELPVFFKKPTKFSPFMYLGVFTELDARQLTTYDDGDAWFSRCKAIHTDIQAAISGWERIPEKEFIEVWDNALRSLSFNKTAEPIPY